MIPVNRGELAEALTCVRTLHAARHDDDGYWEAILTLLRSLRDVSDAAETEATITPEQTLREAGIGSKRQAAYQRKMSAAGRPAVCAGHGGRAMSAEHAASPFCGVERAALLWGSICHHVKRKTSRFIPSTLCTAHRADEERCRE